jgi:hypothetical protein
MCLEVSSKETHGKTPVDGVFGYVAVGMSCKHGKTEVDELFGRVAQQFVVFIRYFFCLVMLFCSVRYDQRLSDVLHVDTVSDRIKEFD